MVDLSKLPPGAKVGGIAVNRTGSFTLTVKQIPAGGGGSSDQEALIKDTLAVLNDLTRVYDSVKDKASARAAAPRIDAVVRRMEALKKRADGAAEKQPGRRQSFEEKI